MTVGSRSSEGNPVSMGLDGLDGVRNRATDNSVNEHKDRDVDKRHQ